MRQSLHSLAQAHIVGQAGAQAVAVEAPHPGDAGTLGESEPSGEPAREDDQVRQVRSREKQRCGVRHQDGAVQKGPLVELSAARHVDEGGRQEHDGGVQVEQRGHDRDQAERGQEQACRRKRRPREPRADRREEPVGVGGLADEQEADDERKCGPRLRECFPNHP